MPQLQPDFEKYADQKRFSTFRAGSWRDTFELAVQKMAKPASDLSLLDVGCGDGKYFPFLVERGLTPDNIHGIEVSHKRVERCHAIGWYNARYHEPDQPLPYADGSFDIVNMMEVIEHVPSSLAQTTIRDISRVLKPGGCLLISTPNYPIKRFYDIYDAFMFGRYARLRDDPTHITFYNHKSLSALLAPWFPEVEERKYKNGFLYEKWPKPFLRHKVFYLCRTASA